MAVMVAVSEAGGSILERLAKVEALAAAAGTTGERAAALAAAGRLRNALQAERAARVGDGRSPEYADADMLFDVERPWARRLLIALCHRYAIEPLGDAPDGSVIVRAPRVFLEAVLAPEFARVTAALAGLMADLGAAHGRLDGASNVDRTIDADDQLTA